MVLFASCGTGIEYREKVSEKDVQRAYRQAEARQKPSSITWPGDSLPQWQKGKQFYVTDAQVVHLFAPSRDYNIDTINLQHRVLAYDGYTTGHTLDNRPTVNIRMRDPNNGCVYEYRTDKELSQFHPSFSIPMLIPVDVARHVAAQIEGKQFYIKTPIWYDATTEQMRDGRKFVPVVIKRVLPGNKVMPLRIIFAPQDVSTGDLAMVWLTDDVSNMASRSFDAMFDAQDPHRLYPQIGATMWQSIIHSQVVDGMTKDEVQLSLGAPKQIARRPSQSVMTEIWLYDGGKMLTFIDGLLRN